MKLTHIALAQLTESRANMRSGRKPPDIANILPSIRARGIIQTLLVRPNGFPTTSRSSPGGGADWANGHRSLADCVGRRADRDRRIAACLRTYAAFQTGESGTGIAFSRAIGMGRAGG
jgi:hypothetical protein